MTAAPEFVLPDAEARRIAADPRRNVVLRASAGAGKTTVLVERYLNLIACGVAPANILALTFTRKAAAEMKDRIVRRLADPSRRARPGGRRPETAEVAVSTLDAFTLGLVREFPLDAGVQPGTEVLDERTMPSVMQEAADLVLSGAAGFDTRDVGSLLLRLNQTRSNLRKAALHYLEHRLTWRRLFETALTESRPEPPPPVPIREVLNEVDADRRHLAEDPGTPLPVRMALGAVPEAAEPDSAPGSRDALDRATLDPFFKNKTSRGAGLDPALNKEYKAVRSRVVAARPAWGNWRQERALRLAWAFFERVEREYQRLKRERGVMDFDDLTLAATRLLAKMGEFAESRFRLEARFHHLLLDEFQDTSDDQWELLRNLVRPWTEGAGLAAEAVRDATAGRLDRPTIFLVGDHKQSIYRFRDARVEILGRAEREIEAALGATAPGASPRVILRWNFRSVRRLRRFFNVASRSIAAGSKQYAAEDWAFRYDDSDELPEHPREEQDRGGPGPWPDLSLCVALDHGIAAARIAERVAALVREDPGVLDQGRGVAILARAGARLGIYRAALEEREIPTALSKGFGFFEASEVRDLTALCRFLARPASDLRAVELLRSRFFAVSGEHLALLRRESREDAPFSDLLRSGGADLPEGLSGDARSVLRAAGEAASRYLGFARSMPPSRAIAATLASARYLEKAAAGEVPERRVRQIEANARKVIQILRALERHGFVTMERAAAALEASAGDPSPGPVDVAGAAGVMTIHAAKGLEFEQVFLVDCGRRRPGESRIPRVQEYADGAWGIGMVEDGPHWKVDDGGRADSEEQRCLYVAMTRARKRLGLSWVVKRTRSGIHQGAIPKLLPAELVARASRTVLGDAPERLTWEGFDFEMLPPAATETDDEPADEPAG